MLLLLFYLSERWSERCRSLVGVLLGGMANKARERRRTKERRRKIGGGGSRE